jgi:tetratricopeptide (TPR) repeat protein
MLIGIWIMIFGKIELYEKMREFYKKGEFELARKKVERFLIKYPESKVKDEALYLAGTLRRDPKEAISYYQEIIENYPKSKFKGEALYRMGQYFYVIKRYDLTYYYHSQLSKINHPLSKEAKQWLEKVNSFWFLQLGSFKDYKNAEKVRKKNKKYSPIVVNINGYWKVWIGPFSSYTKVEEFLNSTKLKGFPTQLKK